MLEGLDEIDWANLEHAYGSAHDVPELLRALLASNKNERDEAFYELFANIRHQSTVYEATPYAVPFLAELLLCVETPDKEGVAHLLAVISAGVGYYAVHASDGDDAKKWEQILESKSKNLTEELKTEEAVVEKVREACEPHLELLLPYLRNQDSEIRDSVATAYSFYPSRRNEFLPEMRAALSIEEDEERRLSIQESISALEPDA